MNMLFDALVAPLETRSDAVLMRPDDTQVTGEQLFALSGQIANVLRDAGVEPGHRVAMQCENRSRLWRFIWHVCVWVPCFCH